MHVRDRIALLAIRAHVWAWLTYIVATVCRDRPVPELAWAILPTGVTAIMLSAYGKDYAYRGHHRD